jgi:hypothetical protein
MNKRFSGNLSKLTKFGGVSYEHINNTLDVFVLCVFVARLNVLGVYVDVCLSVVCACVSVLSERFLCHCFFRLQS